MRLCVVDSGNEWFVTGSVDCIIKVWDLVSGSLKFILIGYIE